MMKTNDLPTVTAALLNKLKADGYSNTVLDNTKWILGHFKNYISFSGSQAFPLIRKDPRTGFK